MDSKKRRAAARRRYEEAEVDLKVELNWTINWIRAQYEKKHLAAWHEYQEVLEAIDKETD